METFKKIIETKRKEVEELKQRMREQGSTTVIRSMGEVRSFKQALKEESFLVIPELKKADPWRGTFRTDYNVRQLSHDFELAGAKALAVQVDSKFFECSLDDLYFASKNSNLPILMRDFIIDDAQLTEAKSMGADAVVLMAQLLDANKIRRFIEFAKYIMLEVIVEVCCMNELEDALAAEADVIGVQNRDLSSQTVKLTLSSELRKIIPKDVACFSVGGIKKVEELALIKNAGFKGVLVGEQLMSAEKPADEFKKFVNWISSN